VLYSSCELLNKLVQEYGGQKICVVGAKQKHKHFLQELENNVHIVKTISDSVVAIVSFGTPVNSDKKVICVADNYVQAIAWKDCVICPGFLAIDKEQLSLIVSQYALSGFNYFCQKIFNVEEWGSAPKFFESLNKILNITNINDVCLALLKLRETGLTADMPNGTVLQQCAQTFIFVSLCEHFLHEQPFKIVFKKQTLSQLFGVRHHALNINEGEVCYKLKEFCGDLSFVCTMAKDCIEGAIRAFKHTRNDAGFAELKSLNTTHLVKGVLQQATKSDFNLIKIMQFLGLV